MQIEEFRRLPVGGVARHVHKAGTEVAVFPINGTRRWFLLEHAEDGKNDWDHYMVTASQQHIALYRLLFEHGIHTLLTPIFGPDILERGDGYMAMAAPGMAWLAEHEMFLNFYDELDVRVRFYGDYRRYLEPTPYASLCDVFDGIAERTKDHTSHRLFYGVFAHDATQTVAELSVAHYREHGTTPDRDTLVRLYYGEYVSSVDLFIGFDRFSAFDMPLIASGEEDLYFMVSPSPYLSAIQLRDILYDHLYARRGDNDLDYEEFGAEDWETLRTFYYANRGNTLGVGARHPHIGFWHPLPNVELTWDDHQQLERESL